MTPVAVEITTRPVMGLSEPVVRSVDPEPAGLVIVEDVESLTPATLAACNDDNPYQG